MRAVRRFAVQGREPSAEVTGVRPHPSSQLVLVDFGELRAQLITELGSVYRQQGMVHVPISLLPPEALKALEKAIESVKPRLSLHSRIQRTVLHQIFHSDTDRLADTHESPECMGHRGLLPLLSALCGKSLEPHDFRGIKIQDGGFILPHTDYDAKSQIEITLLWKPEPYDEHPLLVIPNGLRYGEYSPVQYGGDFAIAIMGGMMHQVEEQIGRERYSAAMTYHAKVPSSAPYPIGCPLT